MLAGQHLGEQALQKALAEAAADLRRPQDLLEAGDVLADVEHPLGDLAELAQAPLHRAHHLADVLELALDAAADLPHLAPHVGREVLELLAHGGERLRLRLARACSAGLSVRSRLSLAARLATHRLDLALEQHRCLVGLASPRFELPQTAGHAPDRDPARARPRRRHGAEREELDAPLSARRPRQCRHTGRSPHGSHTRLSRRFRHSPDMRLWQRAKSYFTGSAGIEGAQRAR